MQNDIKKADETEGDELALMPSEVKELSNIISKSSAVGFVEFITGLAGTSKSELLMAAGRVGQG